MNKIERVDRVLNGDEVDRPPVSLWYHFGIQHAGGRQFARITLDFFKYYDFDFLKVMNDYFYQPPQGLDAVKTKEDLKQALKDSNMELIKQELQRHRGLIRKIQRHLYDLDENIRWGAARSFGVATEVFEEEKVRDLLRQLVWMINEESGNNCWFAPQAIGEIGLRRPQFTEPFIDCLKEFYKYPDPKIKEGIEYAFKCFEKAGLTVWED